MNDIELLEALELWHKQVTDARTNYLLLMGEEHEETALHEATLLAAIKFMYRIHSEIEVLRMENQQLQSDIINANMNREHMKEQWESARKIIHRTTIRHCELKRELLDAKAEIERLHKEG